MELGSHEVQKVVMIVLLVATGVLALLCDYLRIRLHRASTANSAFERVSASEQSKAAIAHTLVPEMDVPEAQKSMRASRLAAALRQPRRLVSADVLAVIERNPQDDATSHDTTAPSLKKSKMSRAS